MNIPADLKYTDNDEWFRPATGEIGITDHAQEQLSDIVFVEILVSAGDSISKGDTIATIESVKAAADVYSPVSGTVAAINEDLPSTPELINKEPFGSAWLIKVEGGEGSSLLDPAGYEAKIQA